MYHFRAASKPSSIVCAGAYPNLYPADIHQRLEHDTFPEVAGNGKLNYAGATSAVDSNCFTHSIGTILCGIAATEAPSGSCQGLRHWSTESGNGLSP